MLEDKYDKSEIKDIEYKKVSENEEKVIYSEKFHSKNELKEKKKHENEFTLEKINNKWLISHINLTLQ